MKQMFRYLLPADGEEHRFEIESPPLMAASRKDGREVEFWAERADDKTTMFMNLRIFGTGHEIPDYYTHLISVPRDPYSGLVWHIYRRL